MKCGVPSGYELQYQRVWMGGLQSQFPANFWGESQFPAKYFFHNPNQLSANPRIPANFRGKIPVPSYFSWANPSSQLMGIQTLIPCIKVMWDAWTLMRLFL